MRRVPDLAHQRVVRALQRAGFVVIRQGKHISMYSEERSVVAIIPRHNPVKRTTLASILKEIDMDLEEFLKLL
ncbi:MAG: type II toxin-antitoxin system HicA family toxin [Dehalococcoidia bacterium]|nr:type II toxin-antitoxin system HicA family toxin [Dehalococcoidia bacterium]